MLLGYEECCGGIQNANAQQAVEGWLVEQHMTRWYCGSSVPCNKHLADARKRYTTTLEALGCRFLLYSNS
jgi:hypothetical protein